MEIHGSWACAGEGKRGHAPFLKSPTGISKHGSPEPVPDEETLEPSGLAGYLVLEKIEFLCGAANAPALLLSRARLFVVDTEVVGPHGL